MAKQDYLRPDRNLNIRFDDEEDSRRGSSGSGARPLLMPPEEQDSREISWADESRRKASIRRQPSMLLRAHSHISEQARVARDLARRGADLIMRRRPPLWVRVLTAAYHRYGLKHLVLIAVFVTYTVLGAFLFLVIEEPTQRRTKESWVSNITKNRTEFIDTLLTDIFNNSRFLIYVKGRTAVRVKTHLNWALDGYEQRLGLRWSDQKMEWNFYNALLFAGTICTTIGYGHIYPITRPGRIVTMIYALFGIPLVCLVMKLKSLQVLLILQDIGKLLTMTMKFPWYQLKRIGRRMFRCCTKQTYTDMAIIEAEERRNLAVFDVPLIVGISLIVLWVLLCSFILTIWDQHWSLLEAFYFFFISLSTIGLGDLAPSNPRLLLTMFGLILIGLSLVSMVVNLLQAQMRRTYEAGKKEHDDPTSLGAIQVRDEDMVDEPLLSEGKQHVTRGTQTSMSLPMAKTLEVRSDGVHWTSKISPSKSNDESKKKSLTPAQRSPQVDMRAALLSSAAFTLRSGAALSDWQVSVAPGTVYELNATVVSLREAQQIYLKTSRVPLFGVACIVGLFLVLFYFFH